MRKFLFILFILLIILNYGILAQSWYPPPGIIDPLPGARVTSLYVDNNILYVGGAFYTINGLTFNHIASWNSMNWDTLGSGINSSIGEVFDFQKYIDNLYVGGGFGGASGIGVDNIPNTRSIARWDSINWYSVGGGTLGTTSEINVLSVYNGKLYAGGNFSSIGGVSCCIAKWDGNNWADVGGGIGGSVKSMAVFNNELYVGGSFSSAGGTTAYNIARWNNYQWKEVGGGVNGSVSIMTVDTVNDLLYIGVGGSGFFIWNGYSWTQISGGATGDEVPGGYDLILYHGWLYCGGSDWPCCGYNSLGDTLGTISYWDGVEWYPVEGITGSAMAFEIYKDTLYVGGAFNINGWDSILYIAKWHTHNVPTCLNFAAAISSNKDTAFLSSGATVQFYDSSNITVDSWQWDFGDGATDTVQDPVHSYDSSGNYFVTMNVTCGYFTRTATRNIIVLDTPGINPKSPISDQLLIIYPNPTGGGFVVEINGERYRENRAIKVYGIGGNLIFEEQLVIGNRQLIVDTDGWAKGVYVCKLEVDGKMMESKSIVVE
ncbi:MAG: PKD domain-containing protein [Bacteroidota bacterium]